MKAKGKVFLYNFQIDREKQILTLCVKNGLKVKRITADMFGEKLGALAKRPGYELSGEEYSGEPFEDEMMVMDGLDRNSLNSFLNDFRKAGIKPVALKAVVTEHNCEWNSVELHREIREEHQTMQAREKH